MKIISLDSARKKRASRTNYHPISNSDFAKGIVLESYEDMFGTEPPEETIVYDMDGRQVDDT